MYYGRKKGLIILIVLVVFILLLITGCFAIAYFTTDLFKSNDAMFFKYMGKSLEEMKFVENSQLNSVIELQQINPYTVDGTVTFNAEGTSINKTLTNLSKAKIDYNAKVDPLEEKSYAKAEVKANNNTIFSVEYANSNNIYALKSDDIVTAFIGVENKDLDTLKNKLGISNIEIANEFQTQNLSKVFKISEQEKQHIIEYYTKVLKENIPSSAFTKESNITTKRDGVTYNTTGYRLNLTSTQSKNLKIAILKALKQDSITMNLITTKAKALCLGKDFTEINSLSVKIDEYINEIQYREEGNDLSIIVYVSDGEVITTEIIEKNKAKYTITCKRTDTGITRNLYIENLDMNDLYKSIKINLIENNTLVNSFTNLSITIDDEKTVSLDISNEGSASQSTLNTKMSLSYSDENDNSYSLELNQKIEFVDELTNMVELTRNNCGVLNDYTDEQIQTLVKSIAERIQVVTQEKMDILGVNFAENNTVNPVLNDVLKQQEIETFNSKFSVYKGQISGNSLSTLNTVVKKHNESNENKQVLLTVNGINTAGDSKSIDNNKTYYVDFVYNDEGYIKEIYASEDSETLSQFIQQSRENANAYQEAAANEQQLLDEINQ